MWPAGAAHFVAFLTLAHKSQAAEVVKGISYGPMPCKGPCSISQDDFFSQSAKPMWGRRGRGDLQVMKQLGANTVRLYGNNPENTHRDFLDEAQEFGLAVIPGLSDWDFIQSQHNCLTTDFNCYSQVKSSYLGNLKSGFVVDGAYHPALREVIVINEPDLKLPGMHEPKLFCRGIISAIDGMLDAEKNMSLAGELKVNFTVAFSFGVCTGCSDFTTRPCLGQMAELRAAMLNPESVGYTAKNDLAEFYHTRFHNSFNTANPATHVKSMFLDEYEIQFPSTPVMIQEYHDPHSSVENELKGIIDMAEDSALLNGISFFEFSVRYDKGGTEMDFGMFKLGDYAVTDFDYFGDPFQAWCLVPSDKAGESMPNAVAEAYGGEGLDFSSLCKPDASKVALSPDGFQQIRQRTADIVVFVDRLTTQLGGTVYDQDALNSFVEHFTSSSAAQESGAADFNLLVTALTKLPTWASWNEKASCIADRDSHAPAIGNAVGIACGLLHTFDCDEIPASCRSNVWDVADYVFGVYYAEKSGTALERCYFNGSATLAASEEKLQESKADCVVPIDWKPTRRLGSSMGHSHFQKYELPQALLSGDEEEAPGILVPALLACLAAFLSVMALITCNRRLDGKLCGRGTAKPLLSDEASIKALPSSDSLRSIQVVKTASTSSIASTEPQEDR